METLRQQGTVARQHVARLQCRGLSLRQGLCGQRLTQLAQLAHACLSLGHRGAGLGQTGTGVAVVQLDQQLPALHRLALSHRHAQHPARALQRDRDALRRDHPTAGDHGLHQLGLRSGINRGGCAQQHVTQQIECGGQHQRDGQGDHQPAAQAARAGLVFGWRGLCGRGLTEL